MGTISSSVGLISGLDIESLVSQLIAIDSRPLNQVKTQIDTVKKQQTAFLEISARLMAAQSAIRRLALPSSFTVRSATSSNQDALTATAGTGTPLGSYTFRINSLATTHQLVSTGFADRDVTPVGAGTLTFTQGQGRVNASTSLSTLNGSQGIRRGIIRIVDGNGGSADVDLRAATTIDDVIEAINGQSSADVRAKVDGDHLVITDQTGGANALRIQDLSGGFAAVDLGIAGSSTTGQIVGHDLVRLADGTRLSVLNDGMGVRTDSLGDDLLIVTKQDGEFSVNLSNNLQFSTKLAALNDGRGVRLPGEIRLTNRKGESAVLTLEGATSVGDVIAAINDSGLSISASLAGSKITLSDTSGGTASNFKIEDVSGFAAADLGITADVAATAVGGANIYRVDTIGGVLRAIQYAEGNNGKVTAAISADGNGIVLTDVSGASGMTIVSMGNSHAAEDLGITGGTVNGNVQTSRDLIAGLNTVLLASLNGGRGVGTGVVQFTRRDGSSVQVDFAGAQTLDEVISRINTATDGQGAPAGLTASVDAGGTGINIQDATAGTGTFSVTDLSGTTAADLHLTAASTDRLASGDLQLKHISETTLLAGLNAGAGIKFGSFRITAADGSTRDVTLSSSLHRTIGDVIKAINNNPAFKVTARVNANGDGIEFVDASGGTGKLAVTEVGSGTTAASLGIVGEAKSGSNILTGSFARQVVITSSDTLDKVAEKINAAGAGVSARVLNDGSATSPYRLVLTSTASGTRGAISYSTGLTGLSFETMTRAQDAVVAVGDGNAPNPILLTSGNNTLSGLVDGLELKLNGTSSQPITVTVAQDVETIVSDMKTFVSAFNNTIDRIDELTRYVADTEEKGILLGDSTVARIKDRLFQQVARTVPGSELTYRRLSQVGVNIAGGATLQFDEAKFREAYAADPDAVRQLFTKVTTDSAGKVINQGVGVQLKEVVDGFVSSANGAIKLRNDGLQDKVDLLTQRAVSMQELLGRKEARLYAQFQAMESTLAGLQSQQTALSNLATQLASLKTK